MEFGKIIQERVAPAALATGAVVGGGYLATAGHLSKPVQNFFGRAVFQLAHFAAAGALAAIVYTATEGLLAKVSFFVDKKEEGKEEVGSTKAILRHAVAITAGVALAAGVGYGVVAAGLVAGSAVAVAGAAAAVAAAAIAAHLVFKAIIGLIMNEEVEEEKSPLDAAKEATKAAQTAFEAAEKALQTLKDKQAFAALKPTKEAAEAKVKTEENNVANAKVAAGVLNKAVVDAEAAVNGKKTAADLQAEITILQGADTVAGSIAQLTKAAAGKGPTDPETVAVKTATDRLAAAQPELVTAQTAEKAIVDAKAARDDANKGAAKLEADANAALKGAQDALAPLATEYKKLEDALKGQDLTKPVEAKDVIAAEEAVAKTKKTLEDAKAAELVEQKKADEAKAAADKKAAEAKKP